ncbi:MAG: CopG family transcriptional regulator, partial [Verrucomicrobia bacterium]
SVRLPAADKAMLVKAAKKQKVSLGEILRAAVESLPEKKTRK